MVGSRKNARRGLKSFCTHPGAPRSVALAAGVLWALGCGRTEAPVGPPVSPASICLGGETSSEASHEPSRFEETSGTTLSIEPREIAPEQDLPPQPFQDPLPGPERLGSAPASRYANLSPGQCRAELRRRGLPTKRVGSQRGVATPLRLDGPLGKVQFLAPGSPSVYGMADCRLVLALHDFSEFLEKQGVTRVRIDNLYRPGARLPGRKRKRSQHAYGLAIDLISFELESGRALVVERDWRGPTEAPPCGPETQLEEATEEAVMLRNIACGAAQQGLFHHVLTPNYNQAHQDHFHMDIQRDARAIVVR